MRPFGSLRPLRAWGVAAALLLAGGGGFLLLAATRPERAPVPPEVRRWPVAAIPAVPGPYRRTLQLFGRVESPATSMLSAPIAGLVQSVAVTEGTPVHRDDVLLLLDPSDARLALAQREAELAEARAAVTLEQDRVRADRLALERERRLLGIARANLERAQDLATRRAGSQAQVDEARERVARQELALVAREHALASHPARLAQLRARLQRAEAARSRAALDLERTRVRSPFDGWVLQVVTAAGEWVRSADPLLEVVDGTRLEVRVELSPPARAALQAHRSGGTGPSSPITVHIGPGRVPAHLDRLGARVVPGRAGPDAFFRLDASGAPLPVGQTVEVTVALPPSGHAVPVPPEGLYGRDTVYGIRQGRLFPVQVRRLGAFEDDSGRLWLLVRGEGLARGLPLLATRVPNAADGLAVRVVEQRTPPPLPGRDGER